MQQGKRRTGLKGKLKTVAKFTKLKNINLKGKLKTAIKFMKVKSIRNLVEILFPRLKV